MAKEDTDKILSCPVPRQKWSDFHKACEGKKVIIIGCGKVLESYLSKSNLKYTIYCFCDNSEAKVGQKLGQILEIGKVNSDYSEEQICPLDILSDIDINNYVFLICSTKYYKELYDEVKRSGSDSIFCYYLLEKERFLYKIEIYKLHISKLADEWLEKNTGWNKRQRMLRKRFKSIWQYPVVQNKIVFISFGGKGYLDHGRYITEEIIRQKLNWEIVWFVSDITVKVPDRIRLVNSNDFEQKLYELSTAKVWISNADMPLYVCKRKEQIYIQTKHWTGITLKKFYLDSRYICKNKSQRYNWKRNGRMMDYVITGSHFDSDSCKRGFRPKGKCIELGSARTDILFHPNGEKERLLLEFGLNKDVHIALYAPTYRFQWQQNNYEYVKPEYQLDYAKLIDALERKFGGEWYVFMKLHPGIREKGARTEDYDKVIDVSLHEDTQELLAICDLLISDYSSIMFEPAYLKKPVFLFATDLEDYLKNDYDMLLDIHSLPFPLAESNEQLMELIKEFNYNQYKQQLERFLEPFHIKEDGHACERIVEFIKDIINVS